MFRYRNGRYYYTKRLTEQSSKLRNLKYENGNRIITKG